jgi:hypothetical protein
MSRNVSQMSTFPSNWRHSKIVNKWQQNVNNSQKGFFLMSCDLLHQVIKGTFKDHLVSWVNEYLHLEHGEKRALEIIQDIDRRYSPDLYLQEFF